MTGGGDHGTSSEPVDVPIPSADEVGKRAQPVVIDLGLTVSGPEWGGRNCGDQTVSAGAVESNEAASSEIAVDCALIAHG